MKASCFNNAQMYAVESTVSTELLIWLSNFHRLEQQWMNTVSAKATLSQLYESSTHKTVFIHTCLFTTDSNQLHQMFSVFCDILSNFSRCPFWFSIEFIQCTLEWCYIFRIFFSHKFTHSLWCIECDSQAMRTRKKWSVWFSQRDKIMTILRDKLVWENIKARSKQ